VTKRRIRVLVADDHAPTRADVARTLGADPRFNVCAEVSDAVAAVDAALREQPDICLLDIRMPGSGILAAREISARLPDTKIVMLTVSDDDRDLFWALRAGASGYLLKTINPERLPAALAGVAAGEPALPRVLVARLMETFRDSNALRRQLGGDDERSVLTTREWQVIELLRQGLASAEIASRLVVSSSTIRWHIHTILKKLQLPSRDALVEHFTPD
jgi:DNA-binding NarL/FixJ family response regulator